ncbi:oligopeptide/dipeptide ABC transporter, ATPase subunit [Thermobaculum terrenum ATCC BAA-798]|uniref:Oligopeptide/dipeptide ABC transporter, ATPase subunit n=1 Tax=Thermobaculum terrenum (strain ATCC BAA-798 / CCMEE 7001 / YNP1) TaxID=525904 RepID=D1CFV9_THET1|nr:ABC transporter ATP-binding protein [Thermobaculum terrenum]ACZ41815.1 oligopeptide/dipeptide ABC transporter, ATPase subunit [Thermobaculum terrenum ATCC BAA-798]
MKEKTLSSAEIRGSERTALSVENLEIGYRASRGIVHAVRGVSFDLLEGESLALIGESGSGKTTMGLSLVRLLPTSAKVFSGKIIFKDDTGRQLDVLNLEKEGLRRFRWEQCAMVFQSALNALNPVLRVRDHFLDTYKSHASSGRVDEKKVIERAKEVLRFVQLDPDRVLNSFPHELSGGMRQRVMIALGLLLNPKVIILDEPTTALDVITQRAIIDVIRRLKQEHEFAMIFISHDLSLAAELADRVATMYAGRVIEIGNVEDVFYKPCHPYTVGLLRAVPTLEGGRKDLISIPGSPPDLIDMPSGCKFHPRCPYATQQCMEEEPPLIDVGNNHGAACWHWQRVIQDWEAGKDAYERDSD